MGDHEVSVFAHHCPLAYIFLLFTFSLLYLNY
jgi:hypothetical protein